MRFPRIRTGEKQKTYVGKTTVGAAAYLRFVDIDEDARVTEGTTASVALDGLFLDPTDGLFVDELDGCQRARLCWVFTSAIVLTLVLVSLHLSFALLHFVLHFLLFLFSVLLVFLGSV
jgi:hypothetical protein